MSDRTSSDGRKSERLRGTASSDQMIGLIVAALEDMGISQAEFARRAGVSEKHLSQVITGKVTPRLGLLDYWAFILGGSWSISFIPFDGVRNPMGLRHG